MNYIIRIELHEKYHEYYIVFTDENGSEKFTLVTPYMAYTLSKTLNISIKTI